MKTSLSIERPATAETIPQRPKVYWVLKRWGGFSTATAELCGIEPYLNPFEHEGLCRNLRENGYDSPQALMKELRKWDRKPAQFTNSSDKFARVEVTRSGFNVVYFPSYRAAVAAHKGEPSEAGLCACTFCRLSDQLEIIDWANGRADGSEYRGDAVICNRCDSIVPLAAWMALPGESSPGINQTASHA